MPTEDNNQPADQSADTGTAPGQQTGDRQTEKTEKTFTQADLDKFVQQRLRERDDRFKEKYGDPDELIKVAAKWKEYEDAQKTEAQKAQDDLNAEKQKRTEAEKRIADLEAARRNDRIDGVLSKIASSSTFKADFPDDVIKYLRDNNAEAVNALMGQDGKVDEKKAATLIDDVKKARPNYFQTGGPGSPSNRGGKAPGAKPKEIGPTIKF